MAFVAACWLLLTGCPPKNDPNYLWMLGLMEPPPGWFTVGGTVVGLVGTGLSLTNNGGDVLSISANGSFGFPAAMADGSYYNVQVRQNPIGPVQTCIPSANFGPVSGASVTDIAITCSTVRAFAVRPNLSLTGLMGTLDVTLNGSETRSITTSGVVPFETLVADGASVSFTVAQRATFAGSATKRNWVSQTCTVSSGSAGVVNGGVVTMPIEVNCVNRGYVYDPDHNRSWKRCVQGQTYRAATNDCRGTGSSAPWGAGVFQYCSTRNNACNDAVAQGDEGPFVHLNGSGTSSAYNTCQGMNTGSGTYSKTNWRVAWASEWLAIQGPPCLEPDLFPDVPGWIWRSSTVPSPDFQFYAYYGGLCSYFADTKDVSQYVLCVSVGP